MIVLRAVIGSIVGLLIGYFAAAFLSGIVMGWFGVSDFEGGRGMAAAFGFGPLGGLLGLVGGVWLGLRRGGTQPVGKALGCAGIALLAIVALAAGGLAIYYYLDPAPAGIRPGQRLARVRAARAGGLRSCRRSLQDRSHPRHRPQPAARDLARSGATVRGRPAGARRHGRALYRTSSRLLVFRFPDGRDRIFRLGLAAKPDPEDGWSDWRAVDFVGLPGQPQTEEPGPEDPLELRYKVRVWGSE